MKPASRLRELALVSVSAALAACGGSGSDASSDSCSVASQNQTVYEIMQQYYLWYQELPELDPVSFSSPDDLLDALRYLPLDRFSYLTTVAAEEELFGSSQFVGVGFLSRTTESQLWVLDVYEGGPADSVGLMRGSRILAVDGVAIEDILASGPFSAALGPPDVGYTFELTFETPGGEVTTAVLTKAVVTIPPVTGTRVFELDGRPTGYLVLRNFVEPSVPALDAAFAQFSAAGVTQVIVDLRYNGGGLVSVLEHFADLLGSRTAPNLPFASYRYNDKNTDRDRTFFFANVPPEEALSLDKLVFVTTASTASAAEMLVNGLPPYITSAVVGAPTFGKPVGQLGFRFCGNVLRPVSFATVNSLGVGDYFDGLPVDCPAADGLAYAFGAAGEDSFDAAVHWLQYGFCPVAPMSLMRRSAPLQDVTPRPLWRPNNAH